MSSIIQKASLPITDHGHAFALQSHEEGRNG